MKILIVEDDNTQCEMLQAIAEIEHWNVTFAHNGLEAIQQFNSDKYNLILMDIVMPEMDGVTAARYIKKFLNKDVTIIGVSANCYECQIEHSLRNGLDNYITKPFRMRTFIDIINSTIKKYNNAG